jgi:hypothetical protein
MPTAAPVSTATVAEELVALCRAGRNLEAIDKLYSSQILSIEPVGTEEMPAEMNGIESVRRKNEWWYENNDVHSVEVAGPFVGDDGFAVQHTFDATYKPTGHRHTLTEMALYTVKDGKIIREQFFYHLPAPE